jgi:hypothetical protein
MGKISQVLREIFSGANGKLSAKRTIGGVAMTMALTSTAYLVIVDRSNEVVENLLTTIIILSASLLGLPAITGVFGRSKINSMSMTPPDDIETTPPPINTDPCDPCEKCPYNKKGTN